MWIALPRPPTRNRAGRAYLRSIQKARRTSGWVPSLPYSLSNVLTFLQRNTSSVLRIRGRDGVKRCVLLALGLPRIPVTDIRNDHRTIVIDVGKNFQTAAVEWFPKYGLRRIDAVLITHAHADGQSQAESMTCWSITDCLLSYEWPRRSSWYAFSMIPIQKPY